MKEPGLGDKLFYDRARRTSLTEHFVSGLTTVEQLMTDRYEEMGDFRNGVFEALTYPPKGKIKETRVQLSRLGQVKGLPLKLIKNLHFSAGDFLLRAEYDLKNTSPHPQNFLFLVEWNLTLLAGDAPDRNYFVGGRELTNSRLNSVGEETGVSEMGMRDGWLELEINFKTSRPAKFWRYPVETISQSAGGLRTGLPGDPACF